MYEEFMDHYNIRLNFIEYFYGPQISETGQGP